MATQSYLHRVHSLTTTHRRTASSPSIFVCIDEALRLARQLIPEDPAELDALIEREGAAAIKAAQDKHGVNYRKMLERVSMGKKALLRSEAPQMFALLLSYPHMLNSLQLFDVLATLGAESRQLLLEQVRHEPRTTRMTFTRGRQKVENAEEWAGARHRGRGT